jgi:hypothetical protein
MTITRIFQTGLELGGTGLQEFDRKVGSATEYVNISSTQKKTGTYSIALTGTGVPPSDKQASYQVDIPATYQLRVGFYIRPGAMTSSERHESVFTVASSTDTNLVHLKTDANFNSLQLFYNGNPGTQIGGNIGFARYSWAHVGLDIKFAASGGWIYWYKDGNLVASRSGSTGTTQAAKVNFGSHPQTGSLYNFHSSDATYFDDIFIDDTTGETSAGIVPGRQFELIKPNGNGYWSGWEGSDGNHTDNYLLVDDTPHDSDSTYVVASSAGDKDSHHLQDFSLPAEMEVKAVIPFTTARKIGTADSKIQVGTRLSGAGESLGSEESLTTSYGILIFDHQATKPGGENWSESDVDNVQVLIASAGDFS